MSDDRVLEARIQKLEDRQKDMVHKADLRELIEEWRENADGMVHKQSDDRMKPFAAGMSAGAEECADDLEGLL